ncbi:hypothetical protein [Priestia megaterium]|nr:hypothetical protein [Priestia megaterium]
MGMLEAAVSDLKKQGYTEEEITHAFMTLIKDTYKKAVPVKNIDELFEEE